MISPKHVNNHGIRRRLMKMGLLHQQCQLSSVHRMVPSWRPHSQDHKTILRDTLAPLLPSLQSNLWISTFFVTLHRAILSLMSAPRAALSPALPSPIPSQSTASCVVQSIIHSHHFSVHSRRWLTGAGCGVLHVRILFASMWRQHNGRRWGGLTQFEKQMSKKWDEKIQQSASGFEIIVLMWTRSHSH